MKAYELAHVTYYKHIDDNLEMTDRTIIPTVIPESCITALDITHLSAQDQIDAVDILAEYQLYVNHHMNTLFSLEDWLAHSGKQLDIKWRKFHPEQLAEK